MQIKSPKQIPDIVNKTYIHIIMSAFNSASYTVVICHCPDPDSWLLNHDCGVVSKIQVTGAACVSAYYYFRQQVL